MNEKNKTNEKYNLSNNSPFFGFIAYKNTKIIKKHFTKDFKKIIGKNLDEALKSDFKNIIHPHDWNKNNEQFEKFINGEIDFFTVEKRIKDFNDNFLLIEFHYIAIEREAEINYILYFKQSKIKSEEEKHFEESERSKQVIFNNLPGLFYRCKNDEFWTMEYISLGFEELTGYKTIDFLYNKNKSYIEIIKPSFNKYVKDIVQEALNNKERFKIAYEIITANNELKWVYELGEGVYNDNGEVIAIEGLVIDINEQKMYEKELKYNAEHDFFTDLYNNKRFYIEFDKRASTQSNNAIILVNLIELIADISAYDLNEINKIVLNVANSLKELMDEENMLYRNHEFGFTYYILNYPSDKYLKDFYYKIRSKIITYFVGTQCKVGIGIVKLNNDDKLYDSLTRGLIASNTANSISDKIIDYSFFNDEMLKEIKRENTLKEEFNEMLKNENNLGLYLNYQPIFNAHGNKIMGFEALVRYNSPKYGFIAPLEMIPLLEKIRLIREVGWKIIIKALEFIKKVNEVDQNAFISINLSGAQMYETNFFTNFLNLIKKYNVNPKNIILEITESVFVNNFDLINNIIKEFRNINVSFAIDDFGVEYSSLSRITNINANILKIDKSFIQNIISKNKEKSIVNEIISIGRKMNFTIIAEGVEEESQLSILKDSDVDYLQGYYLSLPLSDDNAIKLITS